MWKIHSAFSCMPPATGAHPRCPNLWSCSLPCAGPLPAWLHPQPLGIPGELRLEQAPMPAPLGGADPHPPPCPRTVHCKVGSQSTELRCRPCWWPRDHTLVSQTDPSCGIQGRILSKMGEAPLSSRAPKKRGRLRTLLKVRGQRAGVPQGRARSLCPRQGKYGARRGAGPWTVGPREDPGLRVGLNSEAPRRGARPARPVRALSPSLRPSCLLSTVGVCGAAEAESLR